MGGKKEKEKERKKRKEKKNNERKKDWRVANKEFLWFVFIYLRFA